MKTIGKKVTSTFFVNENGYEEVKQRYKELVKQAKEAKLAFKAEQRKPHTWETYCEMSKQKGLYLDASHHLLYLILRGKNYQKAFHEPIRALNFVLPLGAYDGILVDNAGALISKLLPQMSDQEPYVTPIVEPVIEKKEEEQCHQVTSGSEQISQESSKQCKPRTLLSNLGDFFKSIQKPI